MRFKYIFLVIAFQLSAFSVASASERDCILDYPRSVLNNGTFKLNKEKGIATEHIQLTHSTKLYVESGGCEYSTTTYTFIATESPPKVKIVGAEYRKAIELLTLVEKDPKLKLHFSEAKKTLQKYLDLVANPKLKEELYIKDQGDLQFSEKIWIDANLDNSPTKVEVTLSSGPY